MWIVVILFQPQCVIDVGINFFIGIPVVVTFSQIMTKVDDTAVEKCRKIEEAGADVVGFNCGGGPATMLPLVQNVRKVCKVIWCLRWKGWNNDSDNRNSKNMMTSSNGNSFRVTGHLCGEFTGHRWIPHTKASGALMFSLIYARINSWVNNREAGDLRRHPTHCDVILM